ncbi:MAG: hypothetical protein HFG44_04800 [Oscillospiraceae bacterium]|nr:hypothetical protein [Oscillospiraceae bacterium]
MSNLYERDLTFASDEMLYQAVEMYGTPLLVYSEETLRSRVEKVKAAFSCCGAFQEFFPVKACPNLEILRILVESGCGLVCGSHVELHLAQMAGAGNENILYLSAFPDERDYAAVQCVKPRLVLDSPAHLSSYMETDCLTEPLGLRFNPGARFCVPGHLPFRIASRFGMLKDELLETAEKAAKLGVRTFGLHLHLGSNIDFTGYLAAKAEEMFRLIPELERRTKGTVTYCDIGGGISLHNRQGMELNLAEEANLVREKLLVSDIGHKIAIHTQIGKYLAAPAGILLTKVRGLKEADRTYVGLDISMADVPRMVFCGAQHHVSKLGDASIHNRKSYYLVGKTTDYADHFGDRRILPTLKAGDVLVFHNTGAYTRSVAFNYGGNLRCAEVLLSNNRLHLIGQRETEQALFQPFVKL